MPDVRFVFQESWPLDEGVRPALESRLAGLANVELRAVVEPAMVFRDAKLLLAPHIGRDQRLNRPRVVVEAQHLGVPVVASDRPGLRSVVASPELLVPCDASIEQWTLVISRALERYDACVQAARFAAATDPGLDADAVWNGFAALLDRAQN